MTRLLNAKGQPFYLENFQENCDAIRAETPQTLALFKEAQEELRQASVVMTRVVDALIPGAEIEGSEANRIMVHHRTVMYDKFHSATIFMQKALYFLNGFFEANPDAALQREKFRREIEECRRENLISMFDGDDDGEGCTKQ